VRKTNDQKSWLERIVRQVTGVTASFIVLALSSSDRVTATEPDLGLRIWVANYAHVPTRDISKAKGIATSIFNDAGIEMMWIDLPLEGKHLESKYDSRLGDIHLTILRRAAPGTFSPHELGFAMPCPEPKVGCLAYISYSLIEDVARDGDVPKSDPRSSNGARDGPHPPGSGSFADGNHEAPLERT